MNVTTTTIRPGLLVGLRSECRGGITYTRQDLPLEEGPSANVEKWETTKVYDDVDEHKRATKERARAVAEVRKACATTSFGLLCPLRNEPELDAAIARAMDIAEKWNETARFTTIRIFALKGKIAETDQEAARAIASEISDLLSDMQNGIAKLDASAVREAANRAKDMASVLTNEQEQRVGEAVKAARIAARAIVKRVTKGGEDAATVISELDARPIEAARMALLDLSPAPAADPDEPAVPVLDPQRAAEIAAEIGAADDAAQAGADLPPAPVSDSWYEEETIVGAGLDSPRAEDQAAERGEISPPADPAATPAADPAPAAIVRDAQAAVAAEDPVTPVAPVAPVSPVTVTAATPVTAPAAPEPEPGPSMVDERRMASLLEALGDLDAEPAP